MLLSRQRDYYKQNDSTKDLLNECGELLIHQLGALRTVVMMKKIISSKKPKYIADKINKKSSSEARRSGSTLGTLNAPLTATRSSFLYRENKLYNLLPEDLKN